MSTEVRVRCSGRMHRVIVSDSGALTFPDHRMDELSAELALAGLGGKPCRCAVVLQVWRSPRRKDWRRLPRALVPARQLAADRGQDRRQRKRRRPLESLEQEPENLPFDYLVRWVLRQADYRQPELSRILDEARLAQFRKVGVQLSNMEVMVYHADGSTPPNIVGGGPNLWKARDDYSKVRGHQGGWILCLLVWVEFPGWRQVYRRTGGLARQRESDRRVFLVQLQEEIVAGQEYVALVGKQGLGLRVDPARCRIRRRAEEWEVVEWLA